MLLKLRLVMGLLDGFDIDPSLSLSSAIPSASTFGGGLLW
jgi:hypothetical protein